MCLCGGGFGVLCEEQRQYVVPQGWLKGSGVKGMVIHDDKGGVLQAYWSCLLCGGLSCFLGGGGTGETGACCMLCCVNG